MAIYINRKMCMGKIFIMDDIQMVIDKLFLNQFRKVALHELDGTIRRGVIDKDSLEVLENLGSEGTETLPQMREAVIIDYD
jgi:hypothetical protein